MTRSIGFAVPLSVLAISVLSGCLPVGSGNGGDADCAGVCGVLMASECFYGGGEGDCNTSCEGWDTQVAASLYPDCPDAWDAYRECMVDADIANCGGVATWNVIECRGEWDHYQNYCVYGLPSTTACVAEALLDSFCAGVAGKPHGKICRGEVEPGCVVGGTSNNADLYCCP